MLRNTLLFSVSIVVVLATSMPAAGALFVETLKFNATADATKDSRYGHVTAISGNIAIIGSHDLDNRQGAAYLVDVRTGLQLAKLPNPAPSGQDRFGFAVDIDGNTAIVSASEKQGSGAAYLYDITNPTAPLLTATLTNPGAGTRFGHDVGISGNTAIVGTREAVNEAYLYNVTTGSLIATLTPNNLAGVDFGSFVAIEGNVASVSDADASQVHLFDVSNPAAPVPGAVLTRSGQFGFGADISGNRAIFGAIGVNNNKGAAYLYDVSDPSNPVEGPTLSSNDPKEGDFENFGYSVAIDGSFAVVGRRDNKAFVYDFAGNFLQKLIASDDATTVDGSFGVQGVSIDGRIVVGSEFAHGLDGGGGFVNQSGAAYVFENPIPEPTSLVLAALGMLALLGFGRRRRRRHAG
jgi:MYXO-CTERM domain-containing protein